MDNYSHNIINRNKLIILLTNIGCISVIFTALYLPIYFTHGTKSSISFILAPSYVFIQCCYTECCFADKYKRYFDQLLLKYTIRPNDLGRMNFDYIHITNKQFFDSTSIINIEIFGIILSEISASMNTKYSIRLCNSFIIIIILITALITLTKRIKFHYKHLIIHIQNKHELRRYNIPKNLEDINKYYIKLKYRPWYNSIKNEEQIIGNNFNQLTDNMF